MKKQKIAQCTNLPRKQKRGIMNQNEANAPNLS